MRYNKTVAVTASGPINVLTGLNGTLMSNYGQIQRTMVRALSIQMRTGGAGIGYVMDGIYGVQADGVSPRVPSKTASGDVTAELQAASVSGPGGQYGDPFVLPNGAAGIDVSRTWVDGASVGDTIVISYDTIE